MQIAQYMRHRIHSYRSVANGVALGEKNMSGFDGWHHHQ